MSYSRCSSQSTERDSMMITSNWFDQKSSSQTYCTASDESQFKLYSISDNLFGFYDQVSATTTEHQNLSSAISQLRKAKVECNIKMFSLNCGTQYLGNVSVNRVTFTLDLGKPPQLMSMLKICENVFDWLARDEGNVVLFHCNTNETLLLTVVYAYSHYYDTMPRRDIHQSVSIKSFLNSHSKSLEKVPVSYRRYAGYMSLYSCLNQLHCKGSSVNIYCLILYNFPAMESDKTKTSQLFFKIYTNDPMKCSHTTKLYCMPKNVNRLVILFDQYPIVLRNDTMIICYHSSLVGNRRTKILRLNFHTCQATGDMLTFYSQDFEDLYPGCPFRIKLDLYFQATAVFGQGEVNFSCDSSHVEPSQLERSDSYSSLAVKNSGHSRQYCSENDDKNVTSLTIIDKTESVLRNSEVKTEKKETKMEREVTKPLAVAILNNSETPNDPTNQKKYKRDKREETRMKLTTELSEAQEEITRLRQTMDCAPKGNSASKNTLQEVTEGYTMVDKNQMTTAEKTVIKSSTDKSTIINKTHNDVVDNASLYTQSHSNNATNQNEMLSGYSSNKEVDLISDLLQAQKEISLLRQSINHLDVTDHSHAQLQKRQMFHEFKRSNNSRTTMEKDNNSHRVYNGRDVSSTFTVECEPVTRKQLLRETNQPPRLISEEIETMNLQPIGKGIHDLNKIHLQTSVPSLDGPNKSPTDIGVDKQIPLSMKHEETVSKSTSITNDSALTLSSIITQGQPHLITLEFVESRLSWWYKPDVSREEAIIVLTQCRPGSFLIRDSNTFSGSYGLAIKVANIPTNIIPKSDNLEVEKIRHYLIEPISSHGVCIKGFPEEPIFPTLSHLVLFYCNTPSVLPCILVMPDKPSMGTSMILPKYTPTNLVTVPVSRSSELSPRTEYSVYYLGCYDVDHIPDLSVIVRAIEHFLMDLDSKKYSECKLSIITGEGIELVDVERKLFFKRRYLFSNITFCATDPNKIQLQLEVRKSNIVRKSKLFGLIVKNCVAGETKCLLFADLYDNQNVWMIVNALGYHLQR